MFFRILSITLAIGITLTLCTTALHADYKKATIRDTFVGKRCVDSEKEENGIEPKEEDIEEGDINLYAYARIMVEHDDGEFLQFDGTEFKAKGIIKGEAPNKKYNGFWYMELDVWKKGKSYPETGRTKWKGSVRKEKELKNKWKDDPKHLKPLVDYLRHCTATACITGGNNLQYYDENSYEAPHQEMAYAYANDFPRAEADDWDELLQPIGLSPADGSYTASAGDSHTVQLPLLSKGASISFYVITPDDAINDVSTFLETAVGDGTMTAASTDYTFPSDVSGDYTFYATISYTDGTSESPHPSYTVSVSLPTPSTPSPGLSPVNATTITINGEEMVDAAPGDTVSVDLVMPSDKGHSQIYWYLAGPGDSGYGSQIGNPTYSSSGDIETTSSFTFSLPSDASGVYTFTAYIYPHSSASDQTVYEYSIKIYCS